MAGQPVTIYDQYGKAISSENALPMQFTGSNTQLNMATPGSLFCVLKPEDYPSASFNGGCASPKVFFNAATNSTQLMFCGFPGPDSSPTNASVRSVYLAEIDSNLQVTNIQEIVPATAFGSAYIGFGDARPQFDPYNQQWIVTCSLYTSSGGVENGYFTMTPTFSAIVDTLVILVTTSGIDGYGYIAWDSGMPMVMGYDKTAQFYFSTTGGNPPHVIAKFQTDDFTARPIAVSTVANPGYTILPPTYKHGSPDVLDVQEVAGGLLVMSEGQVLNQPWSIQFGFMPDIPWMDGSVGQPGANQGNYMINPIFSDIDLAPNTAAGIAHAGHPFYTDVLGFPCLFFVQFRDTFAGAYSFHEIWAYRLPDDWLQTKLFPASARMAYGTSPSSWVNVMGGVPTIEAYLESAAVSGTDVVVTMAGDWVDWQLSGNGITQTYPISPGGSLLQTIDPALPWMMVNFSNTTNLTTKSKINLRINKR